MTDAKAIPWNRISVEAAAIVASILLAFAIDAWWDQRQEAREEQVVLAALLEEFQGKRDLLKAKKKFNEEILEATLTLIRASVDEKVSLESAEVDQLLAVLWWYNVKSDWEPAVLDALIGGGLLTRIANPQLRIDLAQWPVEFEVVVERVARDELYFKSVLLPFLSEHANMAQVYPLIPPMPGGNEQRITSPRWNVSNVSDNTQLLENPQFTNILIEKVDNHLAILELSFSRLEKRLEETIQLLREELSD